MIVSPEILSIENNLRRQGLLTASDGPGFLGMVAACDPQLANAIIRPDLIGWGEPSCGWGWEILNLSGTFDSGAANQQIPFQLAEGIVETDLWVRSVTYTVQRPRAFEGNIFKAQSDYFNRLNPNINFTLTVKSYCRYVISPTETPLENIEQKFECVCPVGFVLGCSSQFSGTFTTLRTLAEDEIPTIVTITLHCVRLPTRYDSCGVNKAIARLQKFGILDEMAQDFSRGSALYGTRKQIEGRDDAADVIIHTPEPAAHEPDLESR